MSTRDGLAVLTAALLSIRLVFGVSEASLADRLLRRVSRQQVVETAFRLERVPLSAAPAAPEEPKPAEDSFSLEDILAEFKDE